MWGYYRAREGLILLSIMLFLYLNVFACFLYLVEYDLQVLNTPWIQTLSADSLVDWVPCLH